jgi:hypothetical protein
VVLKLVCIRSLEGLVQQVAGPYSRVSDPAGQGWDLRKYISIKFSDGADVAGSENQQCEGINVLTWPSCRFKSPKPESPNLLTGCLGIAR